MAARTSCVLSRDEYRELIRACRETGRGELAHKLWKKTKNGQIAILHVLQQRAKKKQRPTPHPEL